MLEFVDQCQSFLWHPSTKCDKIDTQMPSSFFDKWFLFLKEMNSSQLSSFYQFPVDVLGS